MRNFGQIVRDVAGLKWSTVILEESFADMEDTVKLAVKQANSYIFGLRDFPFREKKAAVILKAGDNAFEAPAGTIKEIWVENSGRYLKKIPPRDGDLLDERQMGQPLRCWADYGDNGAVIHVNPTPDTDVNLLYRYILLNKARDESGKEKPNLEDVTDVVNIPDDSTLEDYYMHCLYTKSMVYLIADDRDENYQPYEKEFQEAYRNLLAIWGLRIEPKIYI